MSASLAAGLLANWCVYNFGNSSFNLQPFQAQTFYTVQDAANNPYSTNYTYFFNICANIDPELLPWLGGALNVSTVEAGLYDTDNPSYGIYIKYKGGDQCSQIAQGRSLKVWILCDPDVTNVPDQELVVETAMCGYEIFVRSAFGCPAECPVSLDPVSQQRSLCSNHGICDFDAKLRNSRCFCNNGWAGKDCGTRVEPPPAISAVSGVLIALGIFLAMTLGFLVFLWLRIRSLRLDPAAYSSLRGGPDEGPDDNTIQ